MAGTALIPTASDASKQLAKKPKNLPLKNIWNASDGKPGPAAWRKQTGPRPPPSPSIR